MSIRVLVVDDEKNVADSLALVLQSGGYQARATYNAGEAAGLAVIFRPNLLLCDVMMPGTNGIELAKFFGRSFPDCRVVMMSGYEEALELAQESLSRGDHLSVLTKPIHPETLLAFLADLPELVAPAVGVVTEFRRKIC